MSKIKKLLAVLLTLVMVMGMTITANANSATITVNDADAATLSYIQVIEPEVTSATGWKFSSTSIAEDYKSAFGVNDDQVAIAMLIKAANETVPTTAHSIIKNATAATATQINQALDNVMNGESFSAMANPQTVTTAGVYAILATESGYTYKAMAAYVGFGTVNGNYPTLTNAEVTAKKISTTVTKADDDANNAVAIGDTITYTVTTAFPYFNQNDTNKVFKMMDTIEGAEYVGLTGENKTATAKIGDTPVEVEFKAGEENYGFVADFSSFIDNANSNAGKTVTITYQAVVTEIDVVNTAASRIGEVITNSNPINLYTGQITLTKVDADDNNVKLANAGFEVKNGNTVLTFVQNDADEKVYTFDPEGTITEVFTDENGEVVVEGLDIGTYTFTEKTAPTGYSINETPLNIVLDIEDDGEAVEGNAVKVFADADQMADTKLIALPATGGIGTTIFTVAGCAIMIMAAFFFFASRRKESK